MSNKNLRIGNLHITQNLIFEFLHEAIIEIPGVKGLADFKLFLNKNDLVMTKSYRKTLKNAWYKKSIDVKWDQNTNVYNLNIHVILQMNVNVHTIMSLISERVLYELQEKLTLDVVSIMIYIEEFTE